MDRKYSNWLLALGGMSLLAGLYYRSRKSSGTSLGRVVYAVAEPAPIVGTTKKNGMTLNHMRSVHMPIEQRVRSIQDLVWKSIQDPEMRKLALSMTRKCPERDGKCEARAIYDAIKKRVRYTGDVAPVKMGADGPVEAIDLFQSAARTWEFGGGDCDDHVTLASTMLALNGITSRMRVTSPAKGTEWQHIYVVAGLPKNNPTKWVALDTTLPGDRHFAREVPFQRNLDFPT